MKVAELQSAQTGGYIIRQSPYLTGRAQVPSGPLFISGSVVVSDGRPLPVGVAIERVCGDLTKREAYVDRNGNFSFLLGDGIVLPDASDSGRLYASELGGGFPGFPSRDAVRTPTIYADCALRAQIAGYRSTSINLNASRLVGQVDAVPGPLSPNLIPVESGPRCVSGEFVPQDISGEFVQNQPRSGGR